MATSAVEFIPDAPEIEFIPDTPEQAAPAIEFIPDDEPAVPESVANEARRASAGAIQAMDVMRAPQALDWSDVAAKNQTERVQTMANATVGATQALDLMGAARTAQEQMAASNEQPDIDRFRQSEALRAQAKIAEDQGSGTGPGSEAFNLKRQAESLREQITPGSLADQYVKRQEEGQLQAIEDVGATKEKNQQASFGQAISQFLGPALNANVGPMIDSAARSFVPGMAGALGAASFLTPGGGLARLGLSLLGGFGGGIWGGSAQEMALQSTETPEESAARQQRWAQQTAENPFSTALGEIAGGVAFRPSISGLMTQGGRMNAFVGSAIGMGTEAGMAAVEGREIDPLRMAGIGLGGALYNAPTRLGRAMGFPSHTPTQGDLNAIQGEMQRIQLDVLPTLEPGTARHTQAVNEVRNLQAQLTEAQGGYAAEPTTFEQPTPTVEQPAEAIVPPQPETPNAVQEQSANAGVLRPAIQGQEGVGLPEVGQGNVVAQEAPIQAQQEIQVVPATVEEAAASIPQDPEATLPPPEPPPVVEPPPTAAEPSIPSEGPASIPRDYGNPTGIKNAVVDQERAQRGLPPMDEVVPMEDKFYWNRAKAIDAENPKAAETLISELNEKPRSIDPDEVMLLVYERAKLSSEYRKTDDALLKATEIGDADGIAEAQAQQKIVSDKLLALESASGRGGAGTMQARAFRLRQRLAQEDYSLASMETKLRVLNQGEDLPAKDREKVAAMASKIEQIEPALAAREAELQNKAAEASVDDIIKANAPAPSFIKRVENIAKMTSTYFEGRAINARKRLNEHFGKAQRLGALPQAPDPRVLLDVIDWAASRIIKSGVDFTAWSAEMVRDFGDAVQPYLKPGWDAAEAAIDKQISKTAGGKAKAEVKARLTRTDAQQTERILGAIGERIKEGNSIDGLGNYVKRLAETIARGGETNREAMIGKVVDLVKPIAPDVDRMKVLHLLSNYGDVKTPSNDPAKIQLSKWQGEAGELSKLDSLAKGEPPKRRGWLRRPKGDEERRISKEVKEKVKQMGIRVTDPETQLKSSIDGVKSRLRNDIKDITFQIETGTKPEAKTQVQYDTETAILRDIRDRARQTLDFLEGPAVPTREQQLAVATRALQAQIEGRKQIIAGIERKPKTKRDFAELAALKSENEALAAQIDEMRANDAVLQENLKAEALVRQIKAVESQLAGGEIKKGAKQGPSTELVSQAETQLQRLREVLDAKRKASPEAQAKAMERAEASAEKAIAEYDRQIREADFASKKKGAPVADSERLTVLKAERDAMRLFRDELKRAELPKMTPEQVAIKARKTFLLNQTAKLRSRMANEEFVLPKRKPVDISSDPVALDLMAENAKTKAEFAKLKEEYLLKQQTRTEKILRGIGLTWSAIKNLKVSMDIGAAIQTLPAMLAHPLEAGKAVGKGVRVAFDTFVGDKYAARLEQANANLPNAKNGLYKTAGLDVRDVTGTKREENMGSILERLSELDTRWAGIPDFAKGLLGMNGKQLVRGVGGALKVAPKLLGTALKASNAGFGAIANHMRTRAMDSILQRWFKNTAPTEQQLKILADHINASTGSGGLKGETLIRKILFAPNYYLSIFKNLLGTPVWKAAIKHEGRVATAIASDYVRAVATMTVIQSLNYLFGNRREQITNPLSPNFGKIVTDTGTTFDPTFGRGAFVTLGAQLLTGKKMTKDSKIQKQDEMMAIKNFFAGRISSEIRTGLTLLTQKGYKGQELDALGLARSVASPLSWDEIDKLLEKEGFTRGTFYQALQVLGIPMRVGE